MQFCFKAQSQHSHSMLWLASPPMARLQRLIGSGKSSQQVVHRLSMMRADASPIFPAARGHHQDVHSPLVLAGDVSFQRSQTCPSRQHVERMMFHEFAGSLHT